MIDRSEAGVSDEEGEDFADLQVKAYLIHLAKERNARKGRDIGSLPLESLAGLEDGVTDDDVSNLTPCAFPHDASLRKKAKCPKRHRLTTISKSTGGVEKCSVCKVECTTFHQCPNRETDAGCADYRCCSSCKTSAESQYRNLGHIPIPEAWLSKEKTQDAPAERTEADRRAAFEKVVADMKTEKERSNRRREQKEQLLSGDVTNNSRQARTFGVHSQPGGACLNSQIVANSSGGKQPSFAKFRVPVKRGNDCNPVVKSSEPPPSLHPQRRSSAARYLHMFDENTDEERDEESVEPPSACPVSFAEYTEILNEYEDVSNTEHWRANPNYKPLDTEPSDQPKMAPASYASRLEDRLAQLGM